MYIHTCTYIYIYILDHYYRFETIALARVESKWLWTYIYISNLYIVSEKRPKIMQPSLP